MLSGHLQGGKGKNLKREKKEILVRKVYCTFSHG
jgi:hypothetical protein